jgi:exopolysaccharide biosynthesis polyprenyl glycosylphosphotransferase
MSTIELERISPAALSGVNRRAQQRTYLWMLLVADCAALAVAFLLAYEIRFQFALPIFDEGGMPIAVTLGVTFLFIPICLFIFALFQLYDLQYLLGGVQEYARVFNATSVIIAIAIVLTFLVPVIRISRGWIALCWILATGTILFERFLLRRIIYRLRRRGFLTRRTLIIGADEEARAIADQLRGIPTCGAELLGFVANEVPPGTTLTSNLNVLGPLDRLGPLVEQLGVEEVIVSTAGMHRSEIINIFQTYAFADGIDVRFSPGLFEIFTTGVQVKEIGSVPLVSMNKVRLDPWETAIKSLLDYVAAAVLLIILAPVLLFIVYLIRRDSPGPILHRRRVVGRGGVTFDAYKFRTMYQNGEEILAHHPGLQAELEQNHKLKQDPRITRIGEKLRRASLDELPQLLNVLAGEMSLVGPRMITTQEIEKYGKWRLNLLTVKPGITGLWQISGRSDVTYEERVRLDMYYIRNYTLWLDLLILARTLPAVLRGRGAY